MTERHQDAQTVDELGTAPQPDTTAPALLPAAAPEVRQTVGEMAVIAGHLSGLAGRLVRIATQLGEIVRELAPPPTSPAGPASTPAGGPAYVPSAAQQAMAEQAPANVPMIHRTAGQ